MPLWARSVALAVPGVFVFVGFWLALDTLAFLRASQPATAEVVSVRVEVTTDTDSDGFERTTVSYWPTLRWVSRDGDLSEAESADPMSEPAPVPGDRLPVRYTTGEGARVRPYFSGWTLWSAPFTVLGAGLVVGGALVAAFRLSDAPRRRGAA